MTTFAQVKFINSIYNEILPAQIMKVPTKKEDFPRHKDLIESYGTKIHGSKMIHGHSAHFNEDITEYVSEINCAILIDNTIDKGITLLSTVENNDGYVVGKWEMVCPNNLKLGQIMDRVPFGIIDKTITGFGATTLEITSAIRSSIIVVPTKALAYNKAKWANNKVDGYCMYVGSKYGEAGIDIGEFEIRKYIQTRGTDVRKFIVVADSLPKLLGCLEELGEPVYNDYFLMIDEVDTMQSDSPYRPRLEIVMDYYFRFDFMNRAIVSATVQPFSNPALEKEARLLIRREQEEPRKIKLICTNYIDDTAANIITSLLEECNEHVLVAYNSLDGIFNIIKTLGLKENEYGIMCSERSVEKVKEFSDCAYKAIDENGVLLNRVTFMTCAYFAGIDINTSCHLITLSSNLQPFTYLSLSKITQISGRCRVGNLSETIIYDLPIKKRVVYWDAEKYKESLISRAAKYIEFLNTISNMANSEPELRPMLNFIDSYVSFIGKGKASATDYPLSIIRKNSITKDFRPSYFNIDALVERWYLTHYLYNDEKRLYEELTSQGHIVEGIIPFYIPKDEHNKDDIKQIKEKEKYRQLGEFQSLKIRLLHWIENDNENEYSLEEIRRNSSKRLQESVVDIFKLLYKYISPEYVLDKLELCFRHDRSLRNFLNAAIFYILPIEHPFKASLLASYNVDVNSGVSKVKYSLNERNKAILDVFRNVLHYELDVESIVLSDFNKSFFKWARSKEGDRVNGLNPMGFPPAILHLPNNVNILDIIRLSR